MAYNDDIIRAVWEKGRGIPDQDQTDWRRDQCGAWMHRTHYNNAESEFGWKILNVVAGGGDELDNLQPFQWNNTFDIASSKPQCRVTADRTGLMPTQQYLDQPRNTTV